MANENNRTCPCSDGWVCEEHPDKAWGHDDCVAPAKMCSSPDCDKDPNEIVIQVRKCPEGDQEQLEDELFKACRKLIEHTGTVVFALEFPKDEPNFFIVCGHSYSEIRERVAAAERPRRSLSLIASRPYPKQTD